MSPLEEVKQSCFQVLEHAKHVKIDNQALSKLNEELLNANIAQKKEHKHYLNFISTAQEINYHVLYSLMQFGSGYRHALHKHTTKVRLLM
jgi:hypothetical protein